MAKTFTQKYAEEYLGAHGKKPKWSLPHGLIEWLEKHYTKDNVCDLKKAWDECPRGDWLSWIVRSALPVEGRSVLQTIVVAHLWIEERAFLIRAKIKNPF